MPTRHVARFVPLRGARVAAYLITLLIASVSADAASLGEAHYRIAVAGDQFSGTMQVAAAFDLKRSQDREAKRLRFEVGVFDDGNETRPFLSVGPVWRRALGESRYFVELGISPTLIAGSKFQSEDLGGNFHFTSALVFGAKFRGGGLIALRLQHLSNGGLRGVNPGMDMLGITFTFFGR